MSLRFDAAIPSNNQSWKPTSQFEEKSSNRSRFVSILNIARQHFQRIPFCRKTIQSPKPFANQQPVIVNDGWGKITVLSNGQKKDFKDVVILPQTAVEWKWDWKKPPMGHHPGIRAVDLDHYILASPDVPDVVILSQGRGHGGLRDNPGPGVLEVDSSLISYLKTKGVSEVFIMKTAAAIRQYQDLSALGGKKIAALIHTTC